jgi:uncharacterized damage-inducible protein DinB
MRFSSFTRLVAGLAVGAAAGVGTAGTPVLVQAQQQAAPAAKSATVDALLRDIGQVERKLVGLAEAMPEDKYGYRPGEGVRSVGEVFIHVAADNYFLPTIWDVAAPPATGIKPGDYQSVQTYERKPATKAEAIQALRDSFAHLRAAMQPLDDAFLTRQLAIFGSTMSGLQVAILTTTHLHEHLGQSIAYARSNGVVPPWSRQGG